MKGLAGKVLFAFAEAGFLVLLGVDLLVYEVKTWRFWHNAKCLKTYYNNGEWHTVEE